MTPFGELALKRLRTCRKTDYSITVTNTMQRPLCFPPACLVICNYHQGDCVIVEDVSEGYIKDNSSKQLTY